MLAHRDAPESHGLSEKSLLCDMASLCDKPQVKTIRQRTKLFSECHPEDSDNADPRPGLIL
jgi:hypothetical protein